MSPPPDSRPSSAQGAHILVCAPAMTSAGPRAASGTSGALPPLVTTFTHNARSALAAPRLGPLLAGRTLDMDSPHALPDGDSPWTTQERAAGIGAVAGTGTVARYPPPTARAAPSPEPALRPALRRGV